MAYLFVANLLAKQTNIFQTDPSTDQFCNRKNGYFLIMNQKKEKKELQEVLKFPIEIFWNLEAR